MLNDEQLFCLEGCRSYDQYVHMRAAFEAGVSETASCIFCTLDRTLNKVVWEDANVMTWHVPLKYRRPVLRLHHLIVPKRHVRFVHDLTDAEVVSMQHARRFMAAKYNYQGGLSHTREGPMHFNSGTVPHLHENVFEPDRTYIETKAQAAIARDDDKYYEVRVAVYKDPRDRDADRQRAAEFAARYAAGERP